MGWINRKDWKIVNQYEGWVSKKEIGEDEELKDLIMFICKSLHFDYENIVNLYVDNHEGEFSINLKTNFVKVLLLISFI